MFSKYNTDNNLIITGIGSVVSGTKLSIIPINKKMIYLCAEMNKVKKLNQITNNNDNVIILLLEKGSPRMMTYTFALKAAYQFKKLC